MVLIILRPFLYLIFKIFSEGFSTKPIPVRLHLTNLEDENAFLIDPSHVDRFSFQSL